ncbi:Phosphorylated carbohydrates phosphatase TM_1254 [Sphingobacterium spiritivorum]|uniref:phosphoglycolate phosphatase n=1 Tax=Sphingobacterium spiritivorum TaxID=258 RepID=A0A380BCN7_SPHSI|nr:HAD family phosphatase [Sphingobacterium spiritivorum]SUI98180.1 Phosphorylated carbohydrates phosphatase TM_1254 [Sphingobacterium spiritivorum]
MNKFKAVFFDLDGTLIDSEYFYFQNWQPILAEDFAIHINFEDWIVHFAGHTLAVNIETMKRVWNIDTTDEYMWKRTRAAYAQSDMRTIALMPYAKEILEHLKEHQVKIGLVTSSYQTTVDTVLGQHDLLSYFSLIVTRDNVQSPKPDPEPYLLAAKQSGLNPKDCVAIEDTITGTKAAKAAGLYCIGVTKQPIEQEKLIIADQLFTDLQEVWNYLKNNIS